MAWGEYPPEYNPKVHGTYMPDRWYGKPDTKFGQVKLNEMQAWLSRRNKSPLAIAQAAGRAGWRWRLKYFDAVHGGISGPLQLVVGWSLLFYWLNVHKVWPHRQQKYHW